MALQSTLSHKSTHATGGTDALTPAAIGAVAASEKGVANGIATLDATSKLTASQLPDLAISDFLGEVANEAGMLAKTGEKGDWVTRSDNGKVYVITGATPAQAASWTALSYPVPPTQQSADWTAANGVTQILNKPTLGTAAATASTDYATAAQGAKADSALQSGAAISDISGLQTALDGKAASGHGHALSDLTQSGATNDQVPTWNGTAWVPATPVVTNFQPNPELVADAVANAITSGTHSGLAIKETQWFGTFYNYGGFFTNFGGIALVYNGTTFVPNFQDPQGNVTSPVGDRWALIEDNGEGGYTLRSVANETGGAYPWNVTYSNLVVTKQASPRLVGTALATNASEGTSAYAARADHVHPFPTALQVGAAPIQGGKVPAQYLPSYVDDVVEYASLAALQSDTSARESGKIYVTRDTGKIYRWSGGTLFIEISNTLELGNLQIPDSQVGVNLWINSTPYGTLSKDETPVNGKNSYSSSEGGDSWSVYYTGTQWRGDWSYSGDGDASSFMLAAAGNTTYPWQATWSDGSVSRIGTYNSAVAPAPLGEASTGVGTKAAREDHVHPLPTAAQIGAAISDISGLQTALDGKAATSHTHGNITNAGAIGTTSGVPIITGASGVLQAGSFGATAETFCRGNDSRLADSRQPTLHKSTHAIGGSDVVTPNSIGAAAMGILLDGKFVQYSGIKNGRVSYYSLVSGGIGQENADVSWTGTKWTLRYLHPTGHGTESYHESLTNTDYPWQAFANIKPALNPQAQHTHPLSQIEQSAATNGQVPTWNGTAWVPATPAGGVSKSGDTMTGKLVAAADATASKLNIGNALSANPTTTADGDVWMSSTNRPAWRSNSTIYTAAAVNLPNAFSSNQAISVSTVAPALRVTQTGTGEALRVEDESPDSTPFVISGSGRVGVGVTPDATVAMSVDSTGVKFGDGTIQTTAAAAAPTYTHPTTDGDLHVPATGTTNNGKVLKAGDTAGSLSWGTLTATDVGGVSNGGGAASIMVLTSAQYSAIPAGSIDNNTIYIII